MLWYGLDWRKDNECPLSILQSTVIPGSLLKNFGGVTYFVFELLVCSFGGREVAVYGSELYTLCRAIGPDFQRRSVPCKSICEQQRLQVLRAYLVPLEYYSRRFRSGGARGIQEAEA